MAEDLVLPSQNSLLLLAGLDNSSWAASTRANSAASSAVYRVETGAAPAAWPGSSALPSTGRSGAWIRARLRPITLARNPRTMLRRVRGSVSSTVASSIPGPAGCTEPPALRSRNAPSGCFQPVLSFGPTSSPSGSTYLLMVIHPEACLIFWPPFLRLILYWNQTPCPGSRRCCWKRTSPLQAHPHGGQFSELTPFSPCH